MLSWIPFRAESIGNTLFLMAKVFDPFSYNWLGMKENSYLVATLTLIFFLLTHSVKKYLLPIISRYRILISCLDIIYVGFIFALMVVYFQPTIQFIDFQF